MKSGYLSPIEIRSLSKDGQQLFQEISSAQKQHRQKKIVIVAPNPENKRIIKVKSSNLRRFSFYEKSKPFNNEVKRFLNLN